MPTPNRRYRRLQRAALFSPIVAALALLGGCGQQTESVPSSEGAALTTAATNGLTGYYFNSDDFSGEPIVRVDPEIDFHWGRQPSQRGNRGTHGPPPGKGKPEPRPQQPPSTFLTADPYSVRWTGQIQPSTSGEYTIRFETSGRSRLLVNGIVVYDHWEPGSEVTLQRVTLTAGEKYDLIAEYVSPIAAPSHVRLSWESDSVAQEVVPSSALFAMGSNLARALQVLENDLAFQELGISVAPDLATGFKSADGITLVAAAANVDTYVIALVSGGTVTHQLHVITNGDEAVVRDPARGTAVTIPDMTALIGPDGDIEQEEFDKLVADLSYGLSGRVSQPLGGGQGIGIMTHPTGCHIPPPAYCENCRHAALAHEEAECDVNSDLGWTLFGIATLRVGGVVKTALSWTFGGGVSANGLRQLYGHTLTRDFWWGEYLTCVDDHKTDPSGQCALVMTSSPPKIELRVPIGQTGSTSLSIRNLQDSTFTLEVLLSEAPYNLFDELQRPIYFRLDPGVGWTQPLTTSLCKYAVNPKVIRGVISIGHNASSPASPAGTIVEISCVETGPEADIQIEPMGRTADDLKTMRTHNVNGTINITNLGDAPLEYRIFASEPYCNTWLRVTFDPSRQGCAQSGWVYGQGEEQIRTTKMYCYSYGVHSVPVEIRTNDPDGEEAEETRYLTYDCTPAFDNYYVGTVDYVTSRGDSWRDSDDNCWWESQWEWRIEAHIEGIMLAGGEFRDPCCVGDEHIVLHENFVTHNGPIPCSQSGSPEAPQHAEKVKAAALQTVDVWASRIQPGVQYQRPELDWGPGGILRRDLCYGEGARRAFGCIVVDLTG